MAASIVRCCIAPNSSKLVKRLVLSSRNVKQIRNCSSAQASTDETEDISEENFLADRTLEDELMRIRDVSRLGPRLKKRLGKELPDIDKDFKLSKNYSRRLYGKMGSASGVNPQILWPNMEELKNKIEFDKRFEPTFEGNMKKIKKWESNRARKLETKLERVDKAMAKMPSLIKQFHQKRETLEKEDAAEKAKLARLNREAEEFYGPMKKTDHRRKTFISTRMREERKAEKEARAEAKAGKKKSKKEKKEAEEKSGDGKISEEKVSEQKLTEVKVIEEKVMS
ncbi:growth arrest and DNA damage-inducible proteins-interacting protein 1-like [Mizuhopecten yessoensis]|uniref:Large ribosomal subunit protein mL64 n=1 Tax=Mizuhopecten yessoensis TaxID=6573 RepID=A0A210PY49_MIZYE|nr:growth arrest and DNA damage-inducible proteins-interacting protein 1-like [Mizuhopecten yessoensis]OWF41402.1 Growth arrest and DNA damage-inducible proteins-interacting protein 1 [Mizuhopecten yessoensis]